MRELYYAQTKDHNGVSGRGRRSCPFYEEINAILGTRAASQPPVVLDCGNEGGMEVPVEIGDEQEGEVISNSLAEVIITLFV